jgi:hypothetical protein
MKKAPIPLRKTGKIPFDGAFLFPPNPKPIPRMSVIAEKVADSKS